MKFLSVQWKFSSGHSIRV